MKMINNFGKAILNIRKELEIYIISNKLQSLVLGLSGGIDSALCAALAYPVCTKLNINLIGRSIEIETNTPAESLRGEMIGKCYTTNYKHINLTETYLKLYPDILENVANEKPDDRAFRIRLGNIKARLRMIYLYEQAGKNRGLVLSTDNLTEQFLGFWTLHGDVGDYGMIQQLWKTEVYQMSKYLADNESNTEQKKALYACVDAVPTDGLGITSSDLEQLQAKSYEEVDKILISYIYKKDNKYKDNPIIKRYYGSMYKRTNPLNLDRNIYF